MEGELFRFHATLQVPLESLLKVYPSSGTSLDVRMVPCYYAGNDFRFRIPAVPGLMAPDAGRDEAAVLESEGEVVLVYPAVPSLVEGLKRAAADPASWKSWYTAWSVDLATRSVIADTAIGPEGETLLSALVKPGEESAQWQSTMAQLHQLRWQGRDVWVLIAARVFGGPGRLQMALAEEERRGGPLLKVARGGVIWSYEPALRGIPGLESLQRLGLSHSAVSTAEIRHWDLLTAYQAKHPEGVKFLSANLVYASAPDKTVVPAYDIVESGGLRVALVGVTPKSASKYLAEAGLANATIVDPGPAAAKLVAELRRKADAVVLLSDLDFDPGASEWDVRGVDLTLAQGGFYAGWLPPPDVSVVQDPRPPFQETLLLGSVYPGALTVWQADVRPSAHGGSRWALSERHRLLDDAIPEPEGSPKIDLSEFGVAVSTQPPLLPSLARVYGEPPGSARRYGPRDFWTLVATVLAQETGCETALLHVTGMAANMAGDLPDAMVRSWLDTNESLEVMLLKGSELKPLLAEADSQRQREEQEGDARIDPRYTAGGAGPDQKIHGQPIDGNADYRVLVDRALAGALGLSGKHQIFPVKEPLDELAYAALLKRRGAAPDAVRQWVEGRDVGRQGLWTVNFRDVGLNLQNTAVVRDDAFNSVPNSRIQGFDETDIGETFKADAQYDRQPLRWMNTLEMEYTRSHLRPRNAPPVTNTTANRIMFNTTGTKRVGVIKENWFARQWGPSLGFQYDGQFEADPGLKRKQIYSALPGVSFYDGTWVQNFEFTGVIKRDLSREPPNNQAGLHSRLLVSRDIGPAPVKLQGEVWSNYFFNTHTDTIQDLRVEGDANLKLRVPIRKYLTVAPFVDFYWFALKVRPLWGYSAMTGVQIGFSRLWKPQYEPLLGER